jgi:CBS domain-containing protein
MKTVRRLLQAKGHGIWSIAPEQPASAATRLMAERDVGALLVIDGERLVGIITERDLARKVGHDGHSLESIPVRELMSERVLYVRPEQLIEECMALMIDKRVRHLPVIEGGRIIGLVSMRDVVAEVIAEKSFIIEQLENYIYEIPPHSRA